MYSEGKPMHDRSLARSSQLFASITAFAFASLRVLLDTSIVAVLCFESASSRSVVERGQLCAALLAPCGGPIQRAGIKDSATHLTVSQ